MMQRLETLLDQVTNFVNDPGRVWSVRTVIELSPAQVMEYTAEDADLKLNLLASQAPEGASYSGIVVFKHDACVINLPPDFSRDAVHVAIRYIASRN